MDIYGAQLRDGFKVGWLDAYSRWSVQLAERVGYWKAVVAIAAKNARMCWAALARGENFRLPA